MHMQGSHNIYIYVYILVYVHVRVRVCMCIYTQTHTYSSRTYVATQMAATHLAKQTQGVENLLMHLKALCTHLGGVLQRHWPGALAARCPRCRRASARGACSPSTASQPWTTSARRATWRSCCCPSTMRSWTTGVRTLQPGGNPPVPVLPPWVMRRGF